jgi:hypothetical protein
MMTTTAARELRQSIDSSDDFLSPFNILILYDTQASAVRGLKLSESLEKTLGPSFATNRSMWKFDCLNLSKLQEMAVEDVSRAEVVILAMENNGALPFPVSYCLQTGLRTQNEGTRAIIVSVQQSNEVDNSAVPYLRSFAQKYKFDFFANIDTYPAVQC